MREISDESDRAYARGLRIDTPSDLAIDLQLRAGPESTDHGPRALEKGANADDAAGDAATDHEDYVAAVCGGWLRLNIGAMWNADDGLSGQHRSERFGLVSLNGHHDM